MPQPVPPDGSVLGDGHVALVTGSTSGIGRAVARNLAGTGATVLVHGRDRQRARDVVADLPGEGHDWYVADFADMAAVRQFAGAVLDDHNRLDCLVNNAGTWQGERHLVHLPGAEETVELTFVVNHLAPFLLTSELADRLVATGERRAGDSDGHAGDDAEAGSADSAGPARVVTVSSGLHRQATLDLDAVQGEDGPSGVETYALSKLSNVMFTFELARRLPETVTATCCHPGVAPRTRLARAGSWLPGLGWRLYGAVGRLLGFVDSSADAAVTPTHLAASPDVTGVDGAYFEDCEEVSPAAAAADREAQRDLWETSESWVGLGPAPLGIDRTD